MIQPATYYEVTCDHCGERLEYDGITAWVSIYDAIDALNFCDWRYMDEDQRVCCPDCYEELNDKQLIDEQDN